MPLENLDYITVSPAKAHSKKKQYTRKSLYRAVDKDFDDVSPRKNKKRKVIHDASDDEKVNQRADVNLKAPIENINLNADEFLLSISPRSYIKRKSLKNSQGGVERESDQETEIDENSDENVGHFVSPKYGSSSPHSAVRSHHSYPTTPTRRPRNLSQIFEHISPSTSLYEEHSPVRKRHHSLTQRMLSRSSPGSSALIASTSSSFNEELAGQSTSRSQRLKSSLPSARDERSTEDCVEPTTFHENDSEIINSISSIVRVASQSKTRTYAGKSRSFLVAVPIENFVGEQKSDSDVLGVNLTDADREALRESYSELRLRWGVDNNEDNDSNFQIGDVHDSQHSNPDLYNPLSSITELRTKGESRRILDEIEYLFEGLESDSNSKAIKRSTAVELLNKMCKPDFMRKAKAVNFLERAWDALRVAGGGNGDKLLDICLCVFVALVAQDRRDLMDLSRRPDVFSTLISLLHDVYQCDLNITNNDNMSVERMGFDKIDKNLLRRLCAIVKVIPDLIEEDSKDLFVRELISWTLRTIPSQTYYRIVVVLDSVIKDLSSLPSRIFAATESPLHARNDDFSLRHICNCLDIIDSYLLDRPLLQAPEVHDDMHYLKVMDEKKASLIPGLISILSLSLSNANDSETSDSQIVDYRCLESALRILVNLSNDDANWCEEILNNQRSLTVIVKLILIANQEKSKLQTKSTILRDSDFATRCLDILCLSLALLTNLVQEQLCTKDLLRSIKFDPNCPDERKCASGCLCPNRISSIQSLVYVYESQTKSEDERELFTSQFIRGHLAILFGLLMKDNESNQRLLLTLLPGISKSARLKFLISNAEDFIALYTDDYLRYDEKITAEHRRSLTAINNITTNTQSDEKTSATAAMEVIKELNNLRSLFV